MPGSPFLVLDSVALSPTGRSLTLSLNAGERMSLIGSVESGSSDLIKICLREEKPHSGSAQFNGPILRPTASPKGAQPKFNFRSTPLALAKTYVVGSSTRAAGVLAMLDLWDTRDTLVSKLPKEKTAALELLPVMMPTEGLVVIDGQFDRLDPRVADDVCEEIGGPEHAGKAFLIGTNSPWIVERVGRVVVMRGGNPVFAGSTSELVSQTSPVDVVVETDDIDSAIAIADPFVLSVSVEGGVMRFQAHDGCALAAKLLTEGYGSVKSVVVRNATISEAILRVL